MACIFWANQESASSCGGVAALATVVGRLTTASGVSVVVDSVVWGVGTLSPVGVSDSCSVMVLQLCFSVRLGRFRQGSYVTSWVPFTIDQGSSYRQWMWKTGKQHTTTHAIPQR